MAGERSDADKNESIGGTLTLKTELLDRALALTRRNERIVLA